MQDYELVAVISPEVKEEGMAKIVDKVTQSINTRGGAVDEITNWGRRKLAYPIKKFTEADYLLARFKIAPKLVKELESEIRAFENILRYLVVKVED